MQYSLLAPQLILLYRASLIPFIASVRKPSVFPTKVHADIFRHVKKGNYSFAAIANICLTNALRHSPISRVMAVPFSGYLVESP